MAGVSATGCCATTIGITGREVEEITKFVGRFGKYSVFINIPCS